MIGLRLGEQTFTLHFSIQEMKVLEAKHGSMFVLWNPQNFGYLTAAIMIHAGAENGGKKVYSQDNAGLEKCYVDVKKYVASHKSMGQAILYLYGVMKLALREGEWIPAEDAPPVEKPELKEVVAPKASKSRKPRTSSMKPTPSKPTEFADLSLKSSFSAPRKKSKNSS
jgi:hypothetical protein